MKLKAILIQLSLVALTAIAQQGTEYIISKYKVKVPQPAPCEQ